VASKHLLRLPAARPFAFAVCGSDFKGSSRLESIFRALSSPPDLEIRLAQGGKRRGREEVQRARTGRTDRSLLCRHGFSRDSRLPNDAPYRSGGLLAEPCDVAAVFEFRTAGLSSALWSSQTHPTLPAESGKKSGYPQNLRLNSGVNRPSGISRQSSYCWVK
jgi:hypothetical protein